MHGHSIFEVEPEKVRHGETRIRKKTMVGQSLLVSVM